jgi:hypothetical protein
VQSISVHSICINGVEKTSSQGGPFGLDSNWKPILIGLDWQLVGQRSRFLWLPIGKLDANWPNAVQLAKLANWMPIGRQRPIRPIEHYLMIKTYKKWKKTAKNSQNSFSFHNFSEELKQSSVHRMNYFSK